MIFLQSVDADRSRDSKAHERRETDFANYSKHSKIEIAPNLSI